MAEGLGFGFRLGLVGSGRRQPIGAGRTRCGTLRAGLLHMSVVRRPQAFGHRTRQETVASFYPNELHHLRTSFEGALFRHILK